VATRALLFIEADNPVIGLMCVMAVGMGEVSSCEITVQAGDRVKKGDQLGMFHFGGSTHCLIFRPGVNLEFDLFGQTPGPSADTNIRLNTAIARCRG
jgi:phosphatidylserine decarboxylase